MFISETIEAVIEDGQEYQAYCNLCGNDADDAKVKTLGLSEHNEFNMCLPCRTELSSLITD